MMKYKGYYWTVLTPMIRSSLKKRCSPELASKAVRQGKQEFKNLLSKAYDLGSGNPMESNAYFAYVFVAVWLGSSREIPIETMGKIMEDVIIKMRPFFGLINVNTKKGSRFWYHFMKKYDKWYEKFGKQYPETFKIQFDESLHTDGSYYCITKCPICSFLKEQGIGEIMGILCETDKLMFAMQHGILHREHTIARGEAMCDYWIVGDQVKNPR